MTEMDRDHAIADFGEICRRATLFLSVRHEFHSLRVRDLPSMGGIDFSVARHRYWTRKRYVEELFHVRA